MMRIHVKLFAILKDRAGVGELRLDLPDQATVEIARSEIASRFPPIAEMMNRVAFAVNREYVKRETVLQDGDELALIPPVSGG
jgi:molybdopterin converting factor subunit 1